MSTETNEQTGLAERWDALNREQPRLRQRDAAERLGVTEGELVASRVGRDAVRLDADWPGILQSLEPIGTVLALTRNGPAVIEKTGEYTGVSVKGPMGQVVDPNIDLRLFLFRWGVAYALTQQTPRGIQRSLQVFDRHGQAAHKIFLKADSRVEAFEQLVFAHASDDQAPGEAFLPEPERIAEVPDREIDRDALLTGWAQLTDTHEFVHLLRRLHTTRTQALRLAEGVWTEPVVVRSHRDVFEHAARMGMELMVFVGNRGAIQIHGGPVVNLEQVEGWFNVLDSGFNLHLREDGVASAWVVRKPAAEGEVTSLEIYDAAGDMIAYVFSMREHGQPESAAWRALLAGLERVPRAGHVAQARTEVAAS
ncbi:MAG: hemin-degrading factor [Myxococcales bacterium]|nr:hemin-degrading factor [Myxococcales bacterium]